MHSKLLERFGKLLDEGHDGDDDARSMQKLGGGRRCFEQVGDALKVMGYIYLISVELMSNARDRLWLRQW